MKDSINDDSHSNLLFLSLRHSVGPDPWKLTNYTMGGGGGGWAALFLPLARDKRCSVCTWVCNSPPDGAARGEFSAAPG